MVGQGYFSVNTGYYGMTFGHHTLQGCFPSPVIFILSDTARNQDKATRQRDQFAPW